MEQKNNMKKESIVRYGTMESIKFNRRRKNFREYISYIKNADIPVEDFIFEASAYMGHMSLNRILTLYELYKKVNSIAGHIADVGVYKGASSLLFAKLVKIFESESLTIVHGFDWFRGRISGEKDSDLVDDGYKKSDYDSLMRLIQEQCFDNIIRIHNMDLTIDCPAFFDQYPYLQFKLVMCDIGIYDVLKEAVPHFYKHMVPGGIMIFDHYSMELAPGETLAINELLPDCVIRTIPNSWTPNAYIIKGNLEKG
jgi:hypothetical protein